MTRETRFLGAFPMRMDDETRFAGPEPVTLGWLVAYCPDEADVSYLDAAGRAWETTHHAEWSGAPLFPSRRAAVAQIARWRDDSHDLPEWATFNPVALTADPADLWQPGQPD